MASKKKPKPKPKAKPFTEVEDFYLRGNIGTLTLEDIAKKLGRPLGQVKQRVADLNIDLQASYADRYLSDMRVMGSGGQAVDGVVAMTSTRSMKDDQAARTGGQQFMDRLKSNIAPTRR